MVFGLTTVFWGNPGVLGMSLTLGAYLLVLAVCHYLVVRTLALPRGDVRRTVLLGGAAVLAMGGVVLAIFANVVAAAWFAGVALAVMGVAELFAALYKSNGAKQKSPLRGDWIVSGILGLGTGLLLPVFAAAGAHGLLGVAGGGALMTGALWTLSALTLRHDGGKSKAA